MASPRFFKRHFCEPLSTCGDRDNKLLTKSQNSVWCSCFCLFFYRVQKTWVLDSEGGSQKATLVVVVVVSSLIVPKAFLIRSQCVLHTHSC